MARPRSHNRKRLRAVQTPNEREKRRQAEKARKAARHRRNARHG